MDSARKLPEPPVPELARELHALVRNGKAFPYADAEEQRYYELIATRWLEKIRAGERAGSAVPAVPPDPEDGSAFFQTAWAEHGRCTCLPGDTIYCEEERCALCTSLPPEWPCPTTEHRGYPGEPPAAVPDPPRTRGEAASSLLVPDPPSAPDEADRLCDAMHEHRNDLLQALESVYSDAPWDWIVAEVAKLRAARMNKTHKQRGFWRDLWASLKRDSWVWNGDGRKLP